MPKGIVTYTHVLNVLSGNVKRYRGPADGRTLAEHVPGIGGLVFEVNGRAEDPDYVPVAGDSVTFGDVPKDPTTITFIVISLIIAAGSYLLNRLTMPKLPDERTGEDFGPRSTFGGIQTQAQSGTPIPLILGGPVRVGGNIVDSFESATIEEPQWRSTQVIRDFEDYVPNANGDYFVTRSSRLTNSKSTLNTRVALAMGPIESVDLIEIDDRPADEYPGLVISTRRGELSQKTMNGFDKSVNTRVLVDPVVFGTPVEVTTQTEVETLEIVLQFPRGIYKVKDDGFRYLFDIFVTVDYRLEGSSVWTELGTFQINDFATTPINWRIFFPELERAKYEIRITRDTADTDEETKISSFNLFILNEIDHFPRTHPGVAMLGFQQLPGDQVSPVNPTNYTALVKGMREVRVYSDADNFTVQWTDNPAWLAAWFITDPENGLGQFFTWEDIDIGSFLEWAAFCDELVLDGNGNLERRATFARQFSKLTNGFRVLQEIATGAGAMLIYRGSVFKAVVDRPTPQVRSFTAANTLGGSFGMAWFPKAELPRRASAKFFNEDTNYKLDSAMQEDGDALPGERLVTKRVQLLQINRRSQVNRELQRIVRSNKFITRGVEFKCGIQGITLELGQVIGISEKSMALGEASGALVEVAANERTLTLDDDVTFEVGTDYEIEIQHLDDGIIDRKRLVPVTANEKTNIVTTEDRAWSRQIRKGDKYAIGVLDETVELYRVDEITFGEFGRNFEMTVRAGKFDPRVYDLTPVSTPADPGENVTPGRNDRPRKIDDDDFTISYRTPPENRRTGRQSRRVIDANWSATEDFDVDSYEVWFREQGKPTWILGDRTRTRRAEIEVGVEDEITYEVAVRGVSAQGLTLPVDASTSKLITTKPEPEDEAFDPQFLVSLGCFYRCDEGGSGTLIDASAAGLNLTQSGGTIGTFTGIQQQARGIYSGLRHHQRSVGIGDTHDITQNGGAVSVALSMWIYMTAQSTDQECCTVWDTAVPASQGFLFRYLVSLDQMALQIPAFGLADGGPGMALNTWYHVGFSYDHVLDELRLYRRQRFAATSTWRTITGMGGFVNTNRHIWRVGGNAFSSSLSYHDLVSWWGPSVAQPLGRSLGLTEFDALYNDGLGLDINSYT